MTLRYERSRPQAGFTLLELLLVMAILGLLMASLPGLLPRSEAALMDSLARSIAASFERTRTQAIRTNRPIDAVFHLDRRRYSIQNQAEQDWPEWVEVEILTAASLMSGDDVGRFRFFADGSSTGGQVTLSGAGRKATIEIGWLTGAVSLVQDNPK